MKQFRNSLIAALVLPMHALAGDQNETGLVPAKAVTTIEEVTVVGRKYNVELGLGVTLTKSELEGLPGTQNDPLRSVIALPGVVVNSDFQTGVAIRGSRPADNAYYVDFLPIGYLFHLTGLSVVDDDLVSTISLQSAGFGAEYQGITGGIVSADTRAPVRSGLHGTVDISTLDAGVVIESALTDRQRFFGSGRVSYYDVLLGEYIEERQEEDGLDIVQLPKYKDYRWVYQLDLPENSTLNFLLDGARDDIEFDLDGTASEVLLDPARVGSYSFGQRYNRVGFVYTLSGDQNDVTVGMGRLDRSLSAESGDIGQLKKDTRTIVVRALLERSLEGNGKVRVGTTQMRQEVSEVSFQRVTGCTEFDVDCLFFDQNLASSDVELKYTQSNYFVDYEFFLGSLLSINLGLGFYDDGYLGQQQLEPRLKVSWQVRPTVRLYAAGGKYSQPPEFQFIEPGFGNPDLDLVTSTHSVVGIDAVMATGLLGSLSVYYKSFDNIVTSDSANRYDNDGVGEAYGAELFLRKGVGRFTGWVSLSWARSFRENTATDERIRFQFDQPIVASVVGKYKLSDTLSFSGKFAYHDGPPLTPILGGDEDPGTAGYFRPRFGEINSDRLPSYLRVDLRVDWLVLNKKMGLYAELVNGTDHRNVSAYDYSADYSSRKDVDQLPAFVAVGAKYRW